MKLVVACNDVATENAEQLGKVKVGVLGCGYWGPKLVRNFHELPEAEITMACDLREDRLNYIRSLYPGTVTTSNFNDLLHSDLDAIVIATPVNTHYRFAKAMLEAGKHVLIEKPMTFSSNHAKELVDLAHLHGLILLVGHTFEYNSAVEAIKRIIESGELGQIYYIDATRVNLGLFRPDINVIWDLASHDLSILRYILSQEPIFISARGKTYVQQSKNIHDVAYLSLWFPNNILATLKVSWLEPVKSRRFTVVGRYKMLVYDELAEDKVVIYDKGVDLHPFSDNELESRVSHCHEQKTIYPIDWVEPLRAEAQHFIDCIRGRTAPRSNGEVGLQIVKMLEAAQQSLLNNGTQIRLEL